ncbi:hypothetical protein OIU74_027264, partial [Salix koriyanagi]
MAMLLVGLGFFVNGELEITCECTPGCDE